MEIRNNNNQVVEALCDEHLIEEDLSTEAGNKLHQMLFHSPKDSKQIEFIKLSLNKFPDPMKPIKLDLDI